MVVRKLVYRHPHVFGDVQVSGTGEVLTNWARLKKTEKHQETAADTLRAVDKESARPVAGGKGAEECGQGRLRLAG
jgi:uncharacterized protein YabN with tetrapyrrole methylase and pyrophosphatase domain